MSKTMSVFLDLLRVSAALVVVVGHVTQIRFSTIWPNQTIVAIGAVAVFFVLSGFVISYVVSEKEHSAFEYATARISRIYSVLFPAVILSSIVFLIGLKLDPALINSFTFDASQLSHPIPFFRVLFHTTLPLTLLNGFGRLNEAYPPLDSPIWSIGFELSYYLIFGIAAFTKGRLRILLLAVTALLCGTEVLRLLPVWLLGVGLHRLSVSNAFPKRSRLVSALCFAAFGIMVFYLPAFAGWINSPHAARLTTLLHGADRAKDAALYYYVGVATAFSVILIVTLQTELESLALALERPIRWFAGRTFSIYLFHLPLLVLLRMSPRYNPASRISVSCAVFADLLLCFLLSTITENKKRWWRTLVRYWLGSLVQNVKRRAMAGRTTVSTPQ